MKRLLTAIIATGPRAIIGSISLGVAREFRVRRIIPQETDSKTKTRVSADAEGQIAIHLPHNSLLVMHAEMQEEWKHSIAPAQAIDPHPISGNKRINITYRDYKVRIYCTKMFCGSQFFPLFLGVETLFHCGLLQDSYWLTPKLVPGQFTSQVHAKMQMRCANHS